MPHLLLHITFRFQEVSHGHVRGLHVYSTSAKYLSVSQCPMAEAKFINSLPNQTCHRSTIGYKTSSGLDYTALTTAIPEDETRVWDLPGAFKRYGDFELASIWFGKELSRRLRDKGVEGVYCNSCHPGIKKPPTPSMIPFWEQSQQSVFWRK